MRRSTYCRSSMYFIAAVFSNSAATTLRACTYGALGTRQMRKRDHRPIGEMRSIRGSATSTTTNNCTSFVNDRFLILPSFLNIEEQKLLTSSALEAHRFHTNVANAANKDSTTTTTTTSSLSDEILLDINESLHESSSSSSQSLNLGLKYCGSPLTALPAAVELSYRAFQTAARVFAQQRQAHSVSISNSLSKLYQSKLTGIALLYGPRATMNAHYDSPTQPNQREEWLIMFTLGNDVLFQLNDRQICLSSGDALVMDAMNVLHGVVTILPPQLEEVDPAVALGLSPKTRLGILLWQSSPPRLTSNENKNQCVDEASNETDIFDPLYSLFETHET
jgi:hypothetical protein